MNKELTNNIDKIHTTKLGLIRIKNNLEIFDKDIIEYIKNIIINKECTIYREGKNYYCEYQNIIITINAYSYTIITAHKKVSS
jgi:hypothetical protein